MMKLFVLFVFLFSQSLDGYEHKGLGYSVIRPLSLTRSLQAPSFPLKGSSDEQLDMDIIYREDVNVSIENMAFQGFKDKVANVIKMDLTQKNEMSLWFARWLLIIVSALYGTNFGIVKILETNLDAGIAAASRFFLAAAIFAPSMYGTIQTNPSLIIGGLECGVYVAIGYWGQANALETTPSSTAAFICSLAVVVVPILESLFGQKSIKSKEEVLTLFLPALLAVAGVACLELGGSQSPSTGDAWALLQPLFFGMGFWRAEKHMKIATEAGDTQAFTGAMMLFVAIFSCVWTVHDSIFPLMDFKDSIDLNAHRIWEMLQTQGAAMMQLHVLASLLWTGLVTTALTSWVENVAMKKLDAVESTVIYSTEPLWGTLFAATFLGEAIGPNTFIGAILIISACLYRTVDTTSIFAALSTAQISALDFFEELIENTDQNVQTLLDSILDQSNPWLDK